jgi:hypothetical protein
MITLREGLDDMDRADPAEAGQHGCLDPYCIRYVSRVS